MENDETEDGKAVGKSAKSSFFLEEHSRTGKYYAD
jgi:hypothetical protein